MLKTRLLQPQILAALGEAGHGARVLIADGNYPLATQSNPAGRRSRTSTSRRDASA
jgi:L-fucose mutarotase